MLRTEEEHTNETEDESRMSEQSEEPASSRSSSRNSSVSKRSSPPTVPQHRYTRDQLLELSKVPLSRKIPDFLDAAHFNTSSGKWDPEKWFVNRRGDKPAPSEEARPKRDRDDIPISLSHKRRTSDPRERVKEEKDEIILSPQRRSFGTGCHIMPQSTFSKRPGSPTDVRDDSYREPSRRIGSGRIMNRDRDRDWDRDHRDYSYGNHNNRRDRYDQDDNEKENRRYSGRYGRGRLRGHERIDEEEPEWFSGGPTSQSETIELVGFEDNTNDHEVKKTNRKGKRSRDGIRKQSMKTEEPEKNEPPPPPSPPTSQPPKPVEKVPDKVGSDGSGACALASARPSDLTKVTEAKQEPEPKPKTPSPEPVITNGNEEKPANVNFDLNDLFKMEWFMPKDPVPEVMTSEMGCSRFTQWFQRESPVLANQGSEDDSRRSSLQDELLAHVLGGIDEPSLLMPSPTSNASDSYFAPISPALHESPNCCIPPPHPMVEGSNKSIMELFQSTGESNNRSVDGEPSPHHNDKPPPPSKSVKELEADLRLLVLGQPSSQLQEDTSAFDRLVSRMNETSSISMGPMDKSKALQEDELLQNILGTRPASPMQSHIDHKKFQSSVANNAGFAHSNHLPQQATKLPSNDVYNKIMMQRREMERHMLEMQHRAKQQQLLLQQQEAQQHPKQNIAPQTFSDSLAKMLEVQPHPPLSPVSSLGVFYGQYEPTNINSMHRNISLVKPELQNAVPQSVLHVQKCQSAKDVLMASAPQTLGLPGLGAGISPHQSPLPPDALHPQGRIPSPLVFGQQPPALSHAPAPIHPNLAQMVQNSSSSNTLQVQSPMLLQRVPSPQELAVHAQTILQNALVKRKLEEQKENFRKRQEAQRTNSPGLVNKTGTITPLKGLSPTIAAFTPTSVMRKMHAADKSESPQQQKIEAMQNGSNKPTGPMDNVLMDQNSMKANNGVITTSGMDGSFVSGMRGDMSHAKNGNVAPRALYGQNMMNQVRSHQIANAAMNSAPSQGRPIVKGSGGQNQNSMNMVPEGVRAISSGNFKQPLMQNKMLPTRSEKYPNLPADPNVEALKFLEQRLLQQQKSLAMGGQQCRQNTSPMPPVHTTAAAAFAFGPRGHSINPNVTANLIRPIIAPTIPAAPNINFPLLRTMIQANSAATMRATPMNQLRALGQLATLQQLRGVSDNRPIQSSSRNYQLQQLFTSQNAATVQAQNIPGLGAHGDGKHLVPGKGQNSRQSPVNLTKWFGSDVLTQKMPEMPPGTQEKALRLEDIERQQQHTIVHN